MLRKISGLSNLSYPGSLNARECFFFVCVCMFVCLVVVGFFYSQFRDAVNNFSSRCFCNAASFFFFFPFHRAFLGKSQPKCCNRENIFMDPLKLQLLQNVFRDRLLPY